MCQLRCSTSIVVVWMNGAAASASRSWTACKIVGVYDDEDAAGCERPLRVLHDLPRLGQVEHDPVESDFVDSLVAVADLDPVVLERVRPSERLHVLLGATREVLAELVAHDLRACP